MTCSQKRMYFGGGEVEKVVLSVRYDFVEVFMRSTTIYVMMFAHLAPLR